MRVSFLFLNLILAVAWMAITGHFTYVSFGFGFVLGLIALWLIREQIGATHYLKRLKAITVLAFVFIYELMKSGFSVAKLVLSPSLEVKPAMFIFPLEIKEPWEITLLANLITLTPGTLTVDVSENEDQLYIHVVNSDDLDAEREGIRNGFERLIKEISA